MHRAVHKLEWAQPLEGWPTSIPRPRPRGVKALGTRYEAAVGKQLGSRAKRGQWWAYRDSNGSGLCQTDFIINGQTWMVILECKHTFTTEGLEQLAYLYLPVVGLALDKRVLGIQVCKHMIQQFHGPIFDDLRAAIEAAKSVQIVTLHWRGLGPLMQQRKNVSCLAPMPVKPSPQLTA